MIRLFEAFSGYGSQSLALKKYGVAFKCVGISEIDKYAIQAHEAIHGPVKNYGDISKINALSLPDMDLFTYSFPCQDISMAGKQKGLTEGAGTRSSLLWECQKIIEMKRPKYLMMENVKNLVGKKHKADFDRWLEVLEGLRYQNYWKVINAKYCGIPQNRERVFCVSILGGGDFKFYDDFDSGVRLKDILEDQVDEKYYLSDEYTERFKKSKPVSSTDIKILGTTVNPKAKGTNCRHWVMGTDGIMGCLSATDYKQPKQIIEACRITGRNPDNPKSRVSGLPTVQMLEVKEESHISNCLTTVQKDSLVLEKPQFRIRKLTPRECFRLMGVSDSDIDKIQAAGISNTQQYKMAGNSIVVDCMKFLEKLNA